MKTVKALFVFLILMVVIMTNNRHAHALEIVTFPDVQPNYWAYDEIMDLAYLGIIGGYPDGTFRPENSVTRAEFTVMLIRALESPFPTETRAIFNDVPLPVDPTRRDEGWANTAVTAAVKRGVIIPAEFGANLGADVIITRHEAAIWTVRALEVGRHFEREAAFARATALGLLDDMANDPTAPTTRAQAAVFITRMLSLFRHEIIFTGEGLTDHIEYVTGGNFIFDYLPSDPILDGFRFLGWQFEDGTPLNMNILVERNITLSPRWHKIYSDITFAGDGVTERTVNGQNGELLSVYLQEQKPPNRRGHLFLGWHLDGAFTERTTRVERDITLTAQWERIDYNLIFALIFLTLATGIYIIGATIARLFFKNAHKKSNKLYMCISILFTILFTISCWSFLKEYIIPVEIINNQLDEGVIIFSHSLSDALRLYSLIGGFVLPILANTLLSGFLPWRFVSPLAGKYRQYLIHLMITAHGLILPVVIWIIYGAGISMSWLVGYAFVVNTIGFFISALLYRRGHGDNCSLFFFKRRKRR